MEKKKRYYKKDEIVWVRPLSREGKVKEINKKELTMTVTYKDGEEIKEFTGNMWDFDKLKYKAKEKLLKKLRKAKRKREKENYFASVNGGVIPTKDKENAGRDCYARLEPVEREGKQVYEMFLPKMKLSKIPLGFASRLQLDEVLSLKWERSSVGELGILVMSGLIDSTYQGEVILQVIPLLHNVLITSEVNKIEYHEESDTVLYPYSKAIAQAVVLKQSDAKDVHITYEELLSMPSKRGTGGWGSTGK